MEAGISGSSYNDKRLDRAVKYVQGLWLPINQNLSGRIQVGLEEGRYDLDPGCIVQELKADLGLFLYCVRELSVLDRQANPGSTTDILTLFNATGLERLKRLLKVEAERISRHDFTAATPQQLAQLQAALVSASTAETLSERVAINGELAFSTAILRQLGLLLVAWNYPTVYQRAIAAQVQGRNIDDTVSELAGFSPTMLAVRLVREWGLSSQIRYAVGGEQAISAEERFEIVAHEEATAQLEEICKIGEALARANDPIQYPNALHDWDIARTEIERMLGTEGLQLIQSKVRQFAEAYQQLSPTFAKQLEEINPERQLKDHREQMLLRNNPFVQQCPLQLRKRLKDFYAQLTPSSVSKEQVAFLVKQVVPHAGFSSGSVLTVDPGTQKLVPRLKFGTPLARPYSNLEIQGPIVTEDPCVAALKCNNPLTGQDDSGVVAYIAGSLGDQQRVGVLYIELPKMLMADSASNYLLHFKAIRQAFVDCLRLR